MAGWRRRSKSGSSGAEGQNGSGLGGVSELRGELEALSAELSTAQAEAARREQEGPRRSKRGLAIVAGVVTVGAGVGIGVALSGQPGQRRVAAPVTSGAPPRQPTLPPVTTPQVTSPPSSAPPGTAPPSAAPPGTASPSTAPPVTSPPSTAPPPTAPTTAAPAGTAPSGATSLPLGRLAVVAPGQSFWAIAEAAEVQILGHTPTGDQVARYWLALIAANASRLPRPGDPNLLYAGQSILLPPV